MLILAVRLDQENLALQFIPGRIGRQHILVSRHADFQVRTGDSYVAQLQPLLSIDEITDEPRTLLLEFQPERQLAPRRPQHDSVCAQFHVIA